MKNGKYMRPGILEWRKPATVAVDPAMAAKRALFHAARSQSTPENRPHSDHPAACMICGEMMVSKIHCAGVIVPLTSRSSFRISVAEGVQFKIVMILLAESRQI